MKRGQVAIEFMFFIGMGVLLFVIFTIIGVNYLQDIYKQKQDITGQDLVDIVRNEINLAGRAENGYHREYRLPTEVGGKDYSITGNLREVYIDVEGEEYIGMLSTDLEMGFSLTKEDIKDSITLLITKSSDEIHVIPTS